MCKSRVKTRTDWGEGCLWLHRSSFDFPHISRLSSRNRNLENETEETARSPFRRGSENRGEKEVPGRCFMIIPSPPLQGVTELLPLLPRRRVRVVALRLRQPHPSGRLLRAKVIGFTLGETQVRLHVLYICTVFSCTTLPVVLCHPPL